MSDFGQPLQRQRVVAGQIAGFTKLGQGGGATAEPVVMMKCAAVSVLPLLNLTVCGIQKSCPCADEFEFAAGQLLPAIIRKILDERIFSRHDFFKVKTDLSGADAPRSRHGRPDA